MTVRIRNYTSTVPVPRTIAAIEDMLGKAGASHIGKSYHGGEVVGFVFQLLVEGRPVTFKLPCNWDAVDQIMVNSGFNGKTWQKTYAARRKAIADQARRTAWRLMHDWIAVQIAMIQLGQAEALQVFLPYAYDATNDRTFFENVRDNGFRQLAAPKDGDQ